MSQPRRIMPLPLGGEHGLPYSRGLMARALMAVGVAPDRAYTLARRVGDDLAARSSDVVEVDRLESLAIECLGEVEGREGIQPWGGEFQFLKLPEVQRRQRVGHAFRPGHGVLNRKTHVGMRELGQNRPIREFHH